MDWTKIIVRLFSLSDTNEIIIVLFGPVKVNVVLACMYTSFISCRQIAHLDVESLYHYHWHNELLLGTV